MARIVIEFEFNEIQEYDDEPSWMEFSSMSMLGTDMSQSHREGIAETFAQSDFYSVGISNEIINLISGEVGSVVTEKDIRRY